MQNAYTENMQKADAWHEISTMDGCQPTISPPASSEHRAQKHSTPIFGLNGPLYEREGGYGSVPGVLLWHQSHRSYLESLSANNGDGRKQLQAVFESAGANASPDSGITFVRTGGSHGTGKAGTVPPMESPTKKRR